LRILRNLYPDRWAAPRFDLPPCAHLSLPKHTTMARRCGPTAVLLLALALGAAWGVAADDDDRCAAGWQPVEAGALLDLAADVATRVSELANATGILTCGTQASDVVDCPRVSNWLAHCSIGCGRGTMPVWRSRPVPER